MKKLLYVLSALTLVTACHNTNKIYTVEEFVKDDKFLVKTIEKCIDKDLNSFKDNNRDSFKDENCHNATNASGILWREGNEEQKRSLEALGDRIKNKLYNALYK